MKKIALLGDSIRLFGYGRIVPELLAGKAEVFQPQENCKFAKNLLRMLFDLKEELRECEVIHFNCGLWDVANIVGDGKLFSTDEEYAGNVLRIAKALLKITPKVIFATTTPVHPEYPHNDNADIARFNSLVLPSLQALGVRINDLNALVAADIDGNLCEDRIHLSEKGARICAERVAAVVAAALDE